MSSQLSEVKVGQVWQVLYSGSLGRKFKVLEVVEGGKYVWVGYLDTARPHRVRIQVRRLRPNSRGYQLLS